MLGSRSGDVQQHLVDRFALGDLADRGLDLLEGEACLGVRRRPALGEQRHQLGVVAGELAPELKSLYRWSVKT